MIPIYGSYKDAETFVDDPSWKNAGALGFSLLTEIPVLKWMKLSKIAKAAEAANKAAELTRDYNKIKRKVDRMRSTPNINPKRINRASNRAGRAHLNMVESRRQADRLQRAAKVHQASKSLVITSGATVDYIQELNNKWGIE